jgi:hypothetical protein
VPPLPAVPDVIRVNMAFSINNTRGGGCVLHFQYSGGAPTVADLNTFTAAIRTAWHAGPSFLQAPTWALEDITATDINSHSGNVSVNVGSTAGQGGSVAINSATATVVNHKIARRYRGGKPKTFLPIGQASELVLDNEWSTAYIALADANWGGFIAALAGATFGALTIVNLVNVSYYSGFTVVTNPITGRSKNVPTIRVAPLVDQIVGHDVQARLGSQRRRLRT